MAIYHCSVKVIGRSSGRSSTGAAAYRAAARIVDDRSGITHDYRRKGGVNASMILAPSGVPSWATDRAQLWNAVEKIEKRKDAQLCREVEVAIPSELTRDQMRELVVGFANAEFVKSGMIADVNFHHLDSENPHAHILLTMRSIDENGFGQKNRDWNKTELLEQWRSAWAEHANRALELAGVDQRIDHRTLDAQGIDRVAQVHLGPKVVEMEQRGVRTNLGTRALEIEATNEKIIDLQKYREAIEYERDQQIKAGAEPRAVSGGDRATGPGYGDAGRRNPPSPSGTGRGQPETSGRVVGVAETISRIMAVSSQGNQEGGGRIDQGKRNGEGVRQGSVMAAVGSGGGGFGDAYSSPVDRIVALARSAGQRAPGGDMAANKNRPVDRTYLAVKRQIEAMKCAIFEVGIRDKLGRMLNRVWSAAEVLKSVPWLKRENAKGSDIYIRPAGEVNQGIILVDDLTQGQITRMKESGLEPAAVIETSPMNYQAWVRLSDSSVDNDVATYSSKAIADRFGADPNSADWRHYGRLAGFTNRKPEHTTETGHNPWVLCHESSGVQASKGPQIVPWAQEQLAKQKAQAESQDRLRAAQDAPETGLARDPVRAYQMHLQRLSSRYGPDMDLSRADFMICCDLIRAGFSSAQIAQAMESCSPSLPVRKAGHQDDYVRRTIQAAIDYVDGDGGNGTELEPENDSPGPRPGA